MTSTISVVVLSVGRYFQALGVLYLEAPIFEVDSESWRPFYQQRFLAAGVLCPGLWATVNNELVYAPLTMRERSGESLNITGVQQAQGPCEDFRRAVLDKQQQRTLYNRRL